MMRYEKEICVGCGQELQPKKEDVVVCPVCGSPQHRACWQQAGGCVAAQQHEEGVVWKPSIPPEEPAVPEKIASPVICPQCGEVCSAGVEQCDRCGMNFAVVEKNVRFQMEEDQKSREAYLKDHFPHFQVQGEELSLGDTVAGQPLEELALQLRGSQRSVQHYLNYFARGGEKGKRFGWNWAAFLLGPYWFFFRKLYQPGLFLAALSFVCMLLFLPTEERILKEVNQKVIPSMNAFMEVAQEKESAGGAEGHMEELQRTSEEFYAHVSRLLSGHVWYYLLKILQWLVFALGAGLFADPLLRRRLWRNIERVQSENLPSEVGISFGRHQLFLRMGGVSWVAPGLYALASIYLPSLLFDLLRQFL